MFTVSKKKKLWWGGGGAAWAWGGGCARGGLRGAAGGSGVLPQGALCEEAVERLLGCGVLRRGQDGALRWIHSVHAPRPLDDVRPMASADWYV